MKPALSIVVLALAGGVFLLAPKPQAPPPTAAAAVVVSQVVPEARIASLVQLLDIPEKRVDALQALLNEEERAAPALPALAKMLQSTDTEERAAVLAAQVLANLDPSTHDAVPALKTCALEAMESRVLVRRACLQALGHFPAFWQESLGVVLNAMGSPDGFVAQESLRSLAVEALPVRFEQLAKSRDIDTLWGIAIIWERSTEGDVIRRIIEERQSELIRILETTDDNPLLNTASNILYSIDTPEAKAALAKSRAIRGAATARATEERKARASTPQTLEQITATIRRSQDPTEDLRSDSVERVNDDDLLMSVHRADNLDASLELWQKRGDKYTLLRTISIDGGAAEFETREVLHFGAEAFLHVQVHYPGTGSFRSHSLYHIDKRNQSVEDVKIVSAPSQFKFQQGEGVQRGEQVNFSSNSITFWFGIWKDGAPGCCPFDEVTGTYVIKQGQGGWTMRPQEMRRAGAR